MTGPGVRRGRLEEDGEGGYIQWVTYTGDTGDQGATVTCTVLQVLQICVDNVCRYSVE